MHFPAVSFPAWKCSVDSTYYVVNIDVSDIDKHFDHFYFVKLKFLGQFWDRKVYDVKLSTSMELL